MLLFIDGVEVDTRSGLPSSVTMTFNGLLETGRTGDRFWDGVLDDAGIWDSEVSARQVAAIHGLGEIPGPWSERSCHRYDRGVFLPGTIPHRHRSHLGVCEWPRGCDGKTSGSLVGEDASIVLDSATGRGVQVSDRPLLRWW